MFYFFPFVWSISWCLWKIENVSRRFSATFIDFFLAKVFLIIEILQHVFKNISNVANRLTIHAYKTKRIQILLSNKKWREQNKMERNKTNFCIYPLIHHSFPILYLLLFIEILQFVFTRISHVADGLTLYVYNTKCISNSVE